MQVSDAKACALVEARKGYEAGHLFDPRQDGERTSLETRETRRSARGLPNKVEQARFIRRERRESVRASAADRKKKLGTQ